MNKTDLLRRIGGFILAAFFLSGIAFTSSITAQAQRRGGRRVIIVRPYHRPFFRSRFGYPYGYGYEPFAYSQYVFGNGDAAVNQGYHDGEKTGREDGRKAKSYSPERSHYFHDSGFGNFAEAYRSGFSRGYRDGYSAGGNGLGR
jgi:hypothetical protein